MLSPAAFCFKGFLVIIKTTNPVEFPLFPFMFGPETWPGYSFHSSLDSLLLLLWGLYPHFGSVDEVDAWFLKVLKTKKKKEKSLSPSPHTFPPWPWVCVLQVKGTGFVHCPSNWSRCVLAQPPVVKTFVGNHSNYPVCWGAAATVLRKKCHPRGGKMQP